LASHHHPQNADRSAVSVWKAVRSPRFAQARVFGPRKAQAKR